jgi:hypothetical protein
MKLLAATLCIAALSITGCATDDESNMGGYLAGMRPAKPSLDTATTSLNPDVSNNGFQKVGTIDTSDNLRDTGLRAEIISDGQYPLPNEVCGGCEVTLITVDQGKSDTGGIGEIDVLSDGGNRLCKIYLNSDGSLDTTNCQR